MVENTKVTINNRQSGEIGNIGYTNHKTKENRTKIEHHMCWTSLYANNQNIT